MTTAGYPTPEPRGDEGHNPAADYQAFVDDFYPSADATDAGFDEEWDPDVEEWPDAGDDEALGEPAVYDVGTGVPARGIIVSASTAAVVCCLIDLALTARLSFFFDLCYVVIALVSVMAVTRRDLFTTGVLPPLLFGGVVLVLTFTDPAAVSSADAGLSGTFLTGLANHAYGLAAAYAAALLAVGARVVSSRRS